MNQKARASANGFNPFIEILNPKKDSKTTVRTIAPGTGLMVFTTIAITGASIGAALGTYVFFGTVTLVGAVVVVESNPLLKKVVSKSTRTIDGILLVGSIVAIAQLGITMAASLTVAGLGYTLVYAPWLRESMKRQSPQVS